MKYILLTITTLLLSSQLIAKPAVDIQVEYLNYDNDTLVLAYHYGEKILIQDTLTSLGDNKFEYKNDEALLPGMYMLVAKPNNTFFQLLISGDDQEFKVKTDFKNIVPTEIKGSEENEAFYAYIDYLSDQRNKLAAVDTLVAHKEIMEMQGKGRKEKLADEVEAYQRQLIEEYKGTIFSMIISANMTFDVPEFVGTDEEKELQRYQYYREHYLDGIDLGYVGTLRTPFIHKKVMFFMDNLTPINADSINKTIDMILGQMEPAENIYQYYLSHFLNHYGNSKYIGLDGVYVHLALNYYDKGKAPWVEADNLEEIVSNAKSMEPTLIGKRAPDFTAKEQDGTEFNLSTFDSKYTVLIFWAPDCGHCTKAMPYLIDFQEKYKDDGAKVVSVCNQVGKKYETCWEGVKEKNMLSFLNVGDQYMKSKVLSKYYVRSTPLILILDENKDIILKKVPAENLDGVMTQILESDKTKTQQ